MKIQKKIKTENKQKNVQLLQETVQTSNKDEIKITKSPYQKNIKIYKTTKKNPKNTKNSQKNDKTKKIQKN